MLAGLVQSPSGDDPIANPQNAMTRRNEVLRAHARPRAHHRPGAASDRGHAGPGGAGRQTPPNGCVDAALGAVLLRLRAELPDRHARASPQDQLDDRRPDHPDDAAAGPAALRRTRACCNNVPMGSPFAGMLDAVAAGHRARAGDERQPPVRLQRTTAASRSTSTSWPQPGAGSTYKVFTAAAALAQGFGAHYTITAPQPYTSKVYKRHEGPEVDEVGPLRRHRTTTRTTRPPTT